MLALRFRVRGWTSLAGIAVTCGLLIGTAGAQPPFQVLVDRSDTIPGTEGLFNSFNAPAIDATGAVVFRGRGSGPQGSAGVQGIYTTTVKRGAPLNRVVDRTSVVPGSDGATFNSFPAFPRIENGRVIFRGVSEPIAPELEGNAGVYSGDASAVETVANRESLVPPDNMAMFDQFPGAPDIVVLSKFRRSEFVAVFKGNTGVEGEVVGQQETESTGAYFRNITRNGPIELIADTATPIPGTMQPFGSVAPPSAQGSLVVFVGSDNEETPTVGGIYVADITAADVPASVRPLVEIGDAIPEGGGATFARFSETLSFDGRTVAFFGSDALAPQDDPEALQGIYTVDVQSLAVKRIADSNTAVPDLNQPFVSFLFESTPMGGENEGQTKYPPFLAIDGGNVAFLAHAPGDVVGIYLSQSNRLGKMTLRTLLDTTNDGGLLDPALAGVAISELNLERDALRGERLVFGATIGDEEEDSDAAPQGEVEEDFQRGLYLNSVTVKNTVQVIFTDGALSVLGDNLGNGVQIFGVGNIPFLGPLVYVGPAPSSGTIVNGAGVYRSVTSIHAVMAGGDDQLSLYGTLNLEELLADGGTGDDTLRRATANITAALLTVTGFETDDGAAP